MNAPSVVKRQTLFQILEKTTLTVAFLYSVIATAYLWGGIASQQPIWPLPELYFLELVLLSGVALLSVMQAWPRRMHVVAAAAGVTTSFASMGVFSIGRFYAPLALLLLVGTVLSWRTSRQSFLTLLGVFVLCATVQTFGMLMLAFV